MLVTYLILSQFQCFDTAEQRAKFALNIEYQLGVQVKYRPLCTAKRPTAFDCVVKEVSTLRNKRFDSGTQ